MLIKSQRVKYCIHVLLSQVKNKSGDKDSEHAFIFGLLLQTVMVIISKGLGVAPLCIYSGVETIGICLPNSGLHIALQI